MLNLYEPPSGGAWKTLPHIPSTPSSSPIAPPGSRDLTISEEVFTPAQIVLAILMAG
jgi:hypothetical protein